VKPPSHGLALFGWLGRTGGRKRAVAALVATTAVTGSVAIAQKPDTADLKVEKIEISSVPIAHFSRENAAQTQFGRLEWRGGLVLTSPSKNFGGWSSLIVERDGSRLFSISDAGAWMTASIDYKNGRISGLSHAKLGPLESRDAKTLKRHRDRDAESTTLVSGTLSAGNILISFEQNARIGRFRLGEDGLSAPAAYVALPSDAKRLSRNKGLEALAVLRGGAYNGSRVAIAERFLDDDGNHTGWIWVKGSPRRFHLTNINGFDITDAAPLPNGGLLVLERRFRWTEGVKMRLRLIKGADLKPGALIEGEVLMEADMAYEIDNMEGLGVHRNGDGETIVTLISDNNFNPILQRTILLQFALKGNGLASTK
jgi:hypothetical protein